jgi:hypothetical protein
MFPLEDAIGSHACSLEANMRVTTGTSPLTSWHCNFVTTLKANEKMQLYDVGMASMHTMDSAALAVLASAIGRTAEAIVLTNRAVEMQQLIETHLWDAESNIYVNKMPDGTVRVFRQKFTLEDAIGSHAFSLEANTRVTNGIPLGSSLLLPVDAVNSVQTRKAALIGGCPLLPSTPCTVLVFGRNLALKDAIGSHTCSLEASKRVTNGIPLG